MTASAAGTVEAPGTSVRAKAGLNRAILRNGWSMARMLAQGRMVGRVAAGAASPLWMEHYGAAR